MTVRRLFSHRSLTTSRIRLAVQRLEDRLAPHAFTIADGEVNGLVTAFSQIVSIYANEANTINLAANGTYEFGTASQTDAHTALAPLSGTNSLTINGNGATFRRSTDT